MPPLPPLSSRSPLPSPVISHSISLAPIASPVPLIFTASTTHPFGTNTSAPSTLSLLHGPGGLDGSILLPFLVVLNAWHVAVPARCLKSFTSSIRPPGILASFAALSMPVCSLRRSHCLPAPTPFIQCLIYSQTQTIPNIQRITSVAYQDLRAIN
ncbi:hypothetical protein J3A83DRAFT_4370648 [Scleroderma citrinum]